MNTITSADIDRLKLDPDKLIDTYEDELATLRHVICGLEQEKADLVRECEQLDSDKLRLDWLCHNRLSVSWSTRAEHFYVQNAMQVVGNLGHGGTCRAVIDSAMTAEPAIDAARAKEGQVGK
jgi:hypothetical protein